VGLLVATLASRLPQAAPQAVPAPPVPVVRLVAVGDILMHYDVKKAGAEGKDGLQGLWAEVTPLLREADIGFANLETPVAPTTGRPGVPFQFNAPETLPAALRASGFTLLATANNHGYDQGPKGVLETLARLKAAGLTAVGSGATRLDAETPEVLTVNGLKVAVLAFTDLFNANLNRKDGQPWVRPLDADALAAVRAARAQADAVLVSVHWGAEYLHKPLERQRKFAAQLAEAGADVILGHHPHVLQPVEMIANGERRTLVVYSMGNFISNQDRSYDPRRDPVAAGDSRDGVAVQCRLVQQRQADGSTRVVLEQVRCEPLWTENNWREHRQGRAPRREIRVIAVNAAIAGLQRELAGLAAGQGAPEAETRRLELTGRLRTLELRRGRALAILGPLAEPATNP
jgi:poly-gamma-glutamate synthesis protein (capsule biosynthesis protein)